MLHKKNDYTLHYTKNTNTGESGRPLHSVHYIFPRCRNKNTDKDEEMNTWALHE